VATTVVLKKCKLILLVYWTGTLVFEVFFIPILT
jgi:hypothetical protein